MGQDAATIQAPPGASMALPVAMLLAAMVSMQLGAAFAERLFPTVGAQGATTLRLGFSALILAAVQRPWRGLRLHRPVLPLVAYGLCLGSMNTLFYMALRTTPLGIAIALEFIGPLSVAILSTRRWADAVWIVLAIGGVALLLPLQRSVHAVDPVGALLALASGIFWALYILFGRRVGQTYGTRGAALGMIIAAVVFIPLGVARTGLAVYAPALLPSGFLLALLSSALPYSLEMSALARITPRAFGTLMSLEPAVGALAGLAMLGESLTALQWTGVGAVIIASLGTSLALRPDARTP